MTADSTVAGVVSQTAEQKLVTPKWAADELEMHNNMNRNISPADVEAIAEKLRAGEFMENGATVTYDWEGEIVDGQHRYAGIVLAGIPARLWIIRGLDPAVRPTVDDIRLRRFRDDLAMNEIKGGATIEAVLRKIMRWTAVGGLARQGRGRVPRLDLAGEFRKRAAEVTSAIEVAREYPRVPLTISNRAFLWWLLRQYADEALVRQFYSIMSIGSQYDKDDVVVSLRDKMLTDRLTIRNREQTLTIDHLFFCIRTWNAWVAGETLGRLRRPDGGITNPFPQPTRVTKRSSS